MIGYHGEWGTRLQEVYLSVRNDCYFIMSTSCDYKSCFEARGIMSSNYCLKDKIFVYFVKFTIASFSRHDPYTMPDIQSPFHILLASPRQTSCTNSDSALPLIYFVNIVMPSFIWC